MKITTASAVFAFSFALSVHCIPVQSHIYELSSDPSAIDLKIRDFKRGDHLVALRAPSDTRRRDDITIIEGRQVTVGGRKLPNRVVKREELTPANVVDDTDGTATDLHREVPVFRGVRARAKKVIPNCFAADSKNNDPGCIVNLGR